MKPKPHGLERRHAEQFSDDAVVAAYDARPPYPDVIDPLLLELVGGRDARVLDLGCGTGELARRIAPRVRAITAVDQSGPMIARARTLPGGDAPNVTWIHGRVEEAALEGPFSAALAAESFHWFDWPRLAPRLGAWLPARRLVLAERREAPSPWSEPLRAVHARYSTNRDFEPYDLVQELTARGLFVPEGRLTDWPRPFRQTVDDYVRSLHSRNGFSLDRMAPAEARACDAAVRDAVLPHARGGVLSLGVVTTICWGRVAAPA